MVKRLMFSGGDPIAVRNRRCRYHGIMGEINPMYHLDSRIIDFLVSQHPIAKVLRDHLVFKIAPMLNPDGVYLGNYRTDSKSGTIFWGVHVMPVYREHGTPFLLPEGGLVMMLLEFLSKDGATGANLYCLHRCSLMGFDLNRHWANPSPWAHPTLHGVKQLIIEMYNNPVFSAASNVYCQGQQF
ncbi:hypothetical protein AAES_43574 [Amazona aestiva]|uniref:Peptidase M14 domain-containing protein n=1 Tax=Amazona aestiva TaxID=12930 RepID=A0A0Q3MSW1_AMAAE|nr:hypothetical protein AAES_43574 [Amazona aestiva]